MIRIRAGLVVLALTLGLTVVAASPAYAAWGGCNALPNRVCTYWDGGGNGAVYYYTGPVNTCIDIGEPWDEDISSVWNRFNHYRVQFWFTSDTCSTGLYAVVGPDTKKDYTNNMYLNDSFNSLKIVPV